MESGLVKRGLDITRRKKKWVILLGLIGFSSFGVYKLYNMPSVVRKRKRIAKLLGSLVAIAEMVSDSAETISVFSRDLKDFLKSDSNEIPNSLKQFSKIARSEEFSESLIRFSQAMTVGVLRGYNVESGRSEIKEVNNSSFSDRLMDKLMSSGGTGFVAVVVGSLARNLVLGFNGYGGSSEGLIEKNGSLGMSYVKSGSSTFPRWDDVVSDAKCRLLISDCIKTFVSTAVAVYLEKTMDVNFYDEMFSGLTNPKHQNKMKDILVSISNGAVETLVKTSHLVLTASKASSDLHSSDSCAIVDQSEVSVLKKNEELERKAILKNMKEMNGSIDLQNSGWVNSVSSTLAVPSNRKFVLDVTGRVTFETVRSVISFLLWKISEGLKTSLNVVHGKVVERGLEVVRYVGAKSFVILTICVALILHILDNTQVLLPALSD